MVSVAASHEVEPNRMVLTFSVVANGSSLAYAKKRGASLSTLRPCVRSDERKDAMTQGRKDWKPQNPSESENRRYQRTWSIAPRRPRTRDPPPAFLHPIRLHSLTERDAGGGAARYYSSHLPAQPLADRRIVSEKG